MIRGRVYAGEHFDSTSQHDGDRTRERAHVNSSRFSRKIGEGDSDRTERILMSRAHLGPDFIMLVSVMVRRSLREDYDAAFERSFSSRS